jgi:hypothetical protein
VPVLHLYAQPEDPRYLTAQRSFSATHPWFQVLKLEERHDVRAAIEARLPQARPLGLPTPIMPLVAPLPLPSAEQVQRGVEQVGEAVQSVLTEIERTLNGMTTTVLENNGVPTEVLHDVLPEMVENQNTLGRGIGRGVSLLQSAAEIGGGLGMMLGGGGEALVTSPAAATGAGAVIPGAGVATVIAGAAVTTHGAAVGINTLHNMTSENANPTSSGSVDTPKSAGDWNLTRRLIWIGAVLATLLGKPWMKLLNALVLLNRISR